MSYPSLPTTPPTASAWVDGQKATYAAGIQGLAVAASATDIFTITGSASKIIRILRLRVSGIKTSAGAAVDVQYIKRSTANSGGTSTAPTIVPFDKNNPTPTATVLAYTANPTLGTLAGLIGVDSIYFNVAATGSSGLVNLEFGNHPGQAIVLRGTGDVFAVNLNGVTVGGGAVDAWIEYSEE